MTAARLAALGAASLLLSGSAGGKASAERAALGPGAFAWRDAGRNGIRGLTIGPIESALHPNKGYGSEPYERTVREAVALGATWVSLTPFGRTWDLAPSGVDPTFEAPFAENRKAIVRAVRAAHAAGLRVLLVPHLWVERGGWRGLLDPGDDDAWKTWAKGYQRFVLAWAAVAEETHVDLLSVGVELRTWVTTTRAPLFSEIVAAVRKKYSGLLTYAANWDDVEDTVIWGDLDVIALNAFFPLADADGATLGAQIDGGARVAERVRKIAETWQKPVLFNEIGYTTRRDAGVKPWIWPEDMKDVRIDQAGQAEATLGLLSHVLDEPWFAGFFVWRVYADPDDMSQEAEWGFSPRGKLAELVVRDAFAARWAGDGSAVPRLPSDAAEGVGRY